VLTEGQGIPLAVVVAGANRHDMKLLADTLDAVVVERPEPTEAAPQHVCLDKGYDYDECRQVAEQHDYMPHIRSRGRNSGRSGRSRATVLAVGWSRSVIHG
jgi:putative transposase